MNNLNPLQTNALSTLEGVVIFSLDAEFCYTSFTDSHRIVMKQIWGVDIAIGHNILEYIQREDDREKARANFNRALAGEEFILEEEFGDDAGHVRSWWEDRYAPIYDDGVIVGLTVFVLDVTHRKKIENALRASESNYRFIMDQAADGIFIASKDGQYQDVNRAGCEMLGFTREEILGMSMHDLVVTSNEPIRFQELFEGKTVISERLMRCKDGRLLSVEINAKMMGDGRLIGIARDITSRRQQEARIRFLAFVMDNISSAVIATDAQLKITHWNKGAEFLYGWTEAEVIGRLIDEVCRTQFLPGQQEEAQKTLLKEGYWRAELKQYHFSGREIWVDVSVRLLEEKGTFIGGVTINHDVTKRRMAEEELRGAKEALEKINSTLQRAFEREQIASRTDGLTGMFNRRFFFELLEYEFSASKRYERPLSLVMFDVDNLKEVNDKFGHQAGDELLRRASFMVRSYLRETDVLARYGGDEFVILVPNNNTQETLALMERVYRALASEALKINDHSIRISISTGIASLEGGVDKPDKLVSCADKALYAAKENGKNCIVVYAD